MFVWELTEKVRLEAFEAGVTGEYWRSHTSTITEVSRGLEKSNFPRHNKEEIHLDWVHEGPPRYSPRLSTGENCRGRPGLATQDS